MTVTEFRRKNKYWIWAGVFAIIVFVTQWFVSDRSDLLSKYNSAEVEYKETKNRVEINELFLHTVLMYSYTDSSYLKTNIENARGRLAYNQAKLRWAIYELDAEREDTSHRLLWNYQDRKIAYLVQKYATNEDENKEFKELNKNWFFNINAMLRADQNMHTTTIQKYYEDSLRGGFTPMQMALTYTPISDRAAARKLELSNQISIAKWISVIASALVGFFTALQKLRDGMREASNKR